MKRTKSIVLLFIMGILLFPWQMLCVTHPTGHNHHEHDGPSLCEQYRMAAQEPGEHLLPPMDCENIKSFTTDYSPTQVNKIVPTVQMVAILAVVFELITLDHQEQPFLIPPDPNCRSATLLSDSPLRGPPLV